MSSSNRKIVVMKCGCKYKIVAKICFNKKPIVFQLSYIAMASWMSSNNWLYSILNRVSGLNSVVKQSFIEPFILDLFQIFSCCILTNSHILKVWLTRFHLNVNADPQIMVGDPSPHPHSKIVHKALPHFRQAQNAAALLKLSTRN